METESGGHGWREATFSWLNIHHHHTLVCKPQGPTNGHSALSLGHSHIQQLCYAVIQNHHFWLRFQIWLWEGDLEAIIYGMRKGVRKTDITKIKLFKVD